MSLFLERAYTTGRINQAAQIRVSSRHALHIHRILLFLRKILKTSAYLQAVHVHLFCNFLSFFVYIGVSNRCQCQLTAKPRFKKECRIQSWI